jgi:DNA-directed RNA polymerase subunit omega
MSNRFDTMMEPPVEELLEHTDSKFGLVALAARRARQINSYYGQLGDGLGTIVPPQVSSTASKSLSIAFEEIAADKILPIELPDPDDEPELEAAEAAVEAEEGVED